MKIVFAALVLLTSLAVPAAAETNQVDELLRKTREALRERKRDDALRLANQAVALAPTNFNALFLRGRILAVHEKSREAIADFDRALKLDPKATGVYQERGTEHFRLGNIDESLADFDKFLELAPQQAAHHWQRGISLYYAGKYDEGRKQFELHQTVNPNDVENAVWHYLCVAKLKGIDIAKAALLPIQSDARVPMMEIYALYAGKGSADAVLQAAAKSGRDGHFYAHLYLALYYDAHKDADKERAHIAKATEEYAMSHYMGAVARVHRKLRKL
jgi:lipoprotein NlpI